MHEAGERDGGVGAAGLELERLAHDGLVAGLDERVRLRGDQLVEELLDARGRLGADERDGCLLGVLTYVVACADCEVLRLHVDECRQGVGTALIAAAIHIARGHG